MLKVAFPTELAWILIPRRPILSLPLLLQSLLLLVACSAGETSVSGSWAGQIDTLETGAIHISNPRMGVWAEGEGWYLVEDLRIGDAEGTGPAAFGAVSLFEVDSQGRVWVFDDYAQEIRVFDQDGHFVRAVGRPGEGPGEFKMVTGMSWSPTGNLWVLDPGNMRFTVFDSAGVDLTSHRIEGGSIIIPWPGGFDSLGRLHHYARRPSGDGEGSELVMVRYKPVLSADGALNPSDTLRIPDLKHPAPLELQVGRRYRSTPVPFAPSPTWRLSPEGEIWFTEADVYALARLNAQADTLLLITKESDPAPVTREELDQAMAELAWFTDAGGRVEPGRIPEQKPALKDFFFQDNGRIWVLPFNEGKSRNPALDLFDADGRYLGEVRAPFPIQVNPAPIIRDGVFYAVSTDEFNLPYVVRARFFPDPEGLD